MPVANRSAYIDFDLSRLPSLPKTLAREGYTSFSIHGYEPGFWKRGINHQRLGFDKTFFYDDLDHSDEIGWGVSDISVVEQAVEKMASTEAPFFAHIILLSNHYPYTYVREMLGLPYKNIVEDYFISAGYVDGAIKRLFERLDEAGLIDDTIVAVYSDHDSGITSIIHDYAGLAYEPLADDRIPLLIYGAGVRGSITDSSGLQDLSPTILYYLGIESPHTFVGLPNAGASVFMPGGRVLALDDSGRVGLELAGLDVETITLLAISRPESLRPASSPISSKKGPAR